MGVGIGGEQDTMDYIACRLLLNIDKLSKNIPYHWKCIFTAGLVE